MGAKMALGRLPPPPPLAPLYYVCCLGPRGPGPMMGGRPPPGRHCVHVRGLPYRATEQDIREVSGGGGKVEEMFFFRFK